MSMSHPYDVCPPVTWLFLQSEQQHPRKSRVNRKAGEEKRPLQPVNGTLKQKTKRSTQGPLNQVPIERKSD